MTEAEYVAAVPNERLRTAISGFLMRKGWEVAMAWSDSEIGACLELEPMAVRVHEGGGPEDFFASLAVTMLKSREARKECEKSRERMKKALLELIEQADFVVVNELGDSGQRVMDAARKAVE
jgi:hypothetical protein